MPDNAPVLTREDGTQVPGANRSAKKRIVVPATALVGLTAIFAKLIGAALWQYYVFYVALGVLGPAAGPVPPAPLCHNGLTAKEGLLSAS